MDESIGYLQNPRVTVEATAPIIQLFEKTSDLKSIRKKVKEANCLDLSDLKELKKSLHKNADGKLKGDDLDAALEELLASDEPLPSLPQGPFLHELVECAELKLPKNPVIERSSELRVRLERLKREQSEREYQQMTKGVSPGKFRKEDTIAFQMQMMNRHLIAVAQVVITVGAGFAFGFFGMPLMVGGLEFGVRLLYGLLVAIIIAIAELYFLSKHLSADDEYMDNPEKFSKPEESASKKHLHQE